MKSFIKLAAVTGLIASTLLNSSLAAAESRYIGMIDMRGLGILIDTGLKVPAAKIVMPAGHVANPELTLPKRTQDRFHNKGTQLPQILPDAKVRFLEKLRELRENPEIIRLAKKIGPSYNVDPAAIVAAVAVELTFNNDFSMKLQSAVEYFPPATLYSDAQVVKAAFTDQRLKYCNPERSDYWSWICVQFVWDSSLLAAMGRPTPNVSPSTYMALPPGAAGLGRMLSPKILSVPAGMSFGPGQITLLRALMASEDVTRVSGGKIPRITIDDMAAVQKMIAQVEPSIHIIAATLGRSVYAYRKYARVDIGGNIGLLASIYNLGSEIIRSRTLALSNTFLKPEQWRQPRENYFGWFANEMEKEIRDTVASVK